MKAYFLFLLLIITSISSGISQEMKTLLTTKFNAKNQLIKLDIQSPYYPLEFKLGIGKKAWFIIKPFMVEKEYITMI